jgi:hypothetical protein
LCDSVSVTKITLHTFANGVVTEAHSQEGYYISDVHQLLLRRVILENTDELEALWGLNSTNTGQNLINILVFLGCDSV